MSGIWGDNIKLSIFGESHGIAIGITIDGLKPGFAIDLEKISIEMARRAPGNSSLSTRRKESDQVQIVSGVFNGKTTGAPLCGMIWNSNQHSSDYESASKFMRPSHADYTGYVKYNGFQDFRGGGHFSGRLTAPIVFAGAICRQMLEAKGIRICSHIQSIQGIEDKRFDTLACDVEIMEGLQGSDFPVQDAVAGEKMKQAILAASAEKNSVGGVIECMLLKLPAGIGEPFFDSLESKLAHLLFSIPAVKGVEFGDGFGITKLKGSEANDMLYMDEDEIKTASNHNGGILGGITNGMPVVFRVAIKPTPSIAMPQQTVDIEKRSDAMLEIKGRHDPCIVQRAIPVIEAVAAIAVMDLISRD